MSAENRMLVIPVSYRKIFSVMKTKDKSDLLDAAFASAAGDKIPEMSPAAEAVFVVLEGFITSYCRRSEAGKKANEVRWGKNKNNQNGCEPDNPNNQNGCEPDNPNNQNGCEPDNPNNQNGCEPDNPYKSKSKSKSPPYSPPPPGADAARPGGSSRKKPGKKTIIKKWIIRGMNRIFHRLKKTSWDEKEMIALGKIADRPDVLAELRKITRLYSSGYEFRRTKILTLLNNWTGELDCAAGYFAKLYSGPESEKPENNAPAWTPPPRVPAPPPGGWTHE